MPGCIPSNNPLELHNLLIKGSPDFSGMTTMNRDMRGVLREEFPERLYSCSTDLLQQHQQSTTYDWQLSFRNSDFMDFFKLLDYKTDVRSYNGGWLVNAHERLTETITEQDIENMENAMAGILNMVAMNYNFLLPGQVISTSSNEWVTCASATVKVSTKRDDVVLCCNTTPRGHY